MALLLSPMSVIPHLQHHMTSTHGPSVPSNLSHSPANAVPQSASKRPKLSLQTTSLTSSYGSLTRGLAPNTTQAIYTPTTANTLSNTWDLSIRPSPISRTDSPRSFNPVRSQAGQQPYSYSLPFGVKPILKNSPLPPRAASVSASPRESRRKVFFPQPKRVLFKQDLEEIIETKQYVTKHSDLTSSDEDPSDDEPQVESTSPAETKVVSSAYHNSPPPNRKRKVRRDSGISIESITETPTLASSATTTTTTDDSDSADDTTIINSTLPCKRRKRQSCSSASFGGLLEKEGIALLRRNSKKETSDNLTITTSDTTFEPGPGHPSNTNEEGVEGRNENSEALSGEGETDEARRTSCSPPTVSQGMPDPKDHDTSLSSKTERDASDTQNEDGEI